MSAMFKRRALDSRSSVFLEFARCMFCSADTSKWSSIARLYLLVMIKMSSQPEVTTFNLHLDAYYAFSAVQKRIFKATDRYSDGEYFVN